MKIKINEKGRKMKTVRIMGTGSALPETIVTNDDLSQMVDTSDQWIQTRTGIRERRISREEETTCHLGALAAERALENAGVDASEIDMILVAASSSEFCFPSIGCQIQQAIGAQDAVAFDISAACSGFLFALHTADAYIQTGRYQNILIVAAETMSKILDWTDRSSCVLFGDGAGACVVSASDRGLRGYVQHSDGSRKDVLRCSNGSMKTPVIPEGKPMEPLTMDGQAVFKFAVKTVPLCITQVLEQTGVSSEEIDYFVLHQANKRILQSVAKRLNIGEEKFPANLDRRGNTSAASIPILLDEMNRRGDLKRGNLLVLSGFGAGLTWAASLLEW